MAIVASNLYSGRVITGDTGYPLGKAQDILNGEKGTGTPLRASWVNDQWGFLQALLDAASITPSGTPDQVGQSDYLDAVNKLIREPLALKIFQSPSSEGLTEIQTHTVDGNEVYEVRKTSDDSLATIYSDAAGTNEIVQNGTDNKSGGDGVVEFYIADGDYYVEVGGVSSNFNVGSATSLSYGRFNGNYKTGDVIKIESAIYDHTMTVKTPFTLVSGESLLDKIEAGLLDVQSTHSLRPFEYPAGWTGPTPEIIWTGGNSYSITGWSERLFRQNNMVKPYGARNKTYYVTMEGNDANGGLSESDSLRTVNAALAKSDCLTIMLKGGGHYSMTTVTSFSVNIIGYGGKAIIFSIRVATGVYEQDNVYSFTDSVPPGVPVSGVLKDEYGTPIPYEQVNSIAEVATKPLSYFNSGNVCYLHASAVPTNGEDVFLAPKNFGNSLVSAGNSNSGNVIYMESLIFPNSFRAISDLNYPLIDIYALNVTAASNVKDSSDNAHEITYCNTYFNRCNASYSKNDGFNYELGEHIEYKCVALANYDDSGSNQASTTHNTSPMLRVDCTYETANQNVILDVGAETTINIGVKGFAESVTPSVSFSSATGRVMYCYDCTPLSRAGITDGHYRNENTGGELMVIDGLLNNVQVRNCTLSGE